MDSLGWTSGAGAPPGRIAVEVLAVDRRLKPNGRLTASRRSAPAILQFLEARGLVARTYEPEPAEWGYRRATEAERAHATLSDLRIYYALDRKALAEVYDAQAARDDPALGRALGYPDCCIAVNDALHHLPMTDMVRVARCAGAAADWRLNIFLTELEMPGGSPYYLVSHFPCSLSCAASRDYAERLLKAIRAAEPGFAARLEAVLRMPVLLRDEREPPEERRYGNSGAVLRGAKGGDSIIYDGWFPMRRGDALADARLGLRGWISVSEEAIAVHPDGSPEAVALDRRQWVAVGFE